MAPEPENRDESDRQHQGCGFRNAAALVHLGRRASGSGPGSPAPPTATARAACAIREDHGLYIATDAAPALGPPGWAAIFVKAFALVAREQPILRTLYVKLPWPGFYELPRSVAMVAITSPLPR